MLEALGEDEAKLREVVAEAVKAEDISIRRRCTAFRKVIPFERLLELYNNPRGWHYDPLIMPYLKFDDEGWPVATSSKIWAILEREGRGRLHLQGGLLDCSLSIASKTNILFCS